jgi:hypothetical protein
MKPIPERTNRQDARDFSARPRRAPFPVLDSHYQVYSLDRYRGGPTGSSPESFFNISRDYFQREARRNFLAEIAFFLIIAAILAGAFIEGARAIIHFLHLPAG